MSMFDAPVLSRAVADARYQAKSSQTGIFNVKEYGAVGDGTTDDRLAIQNATNAALVYASTATKNAVVYFPPAVYMMTGQINWPGSNVGQVTFRGAPATIKFGADGSAFVVGTFAYSLGNYGNITIEDLVFDNNNTLKNWGTNGLILNIDKYPTQFATIKNITVQRCEVRNAPRGATTDPFIECININVRMNDNTARLTNALVDNITIQDCVFGRIGYGGSYAVHMQGILGSNSALGGNTQADLYRSKQWISNTVFNNITLRRIWHDGGPASADTYFANSNFIVGGVIHGDNIICEDLYGNHSGDDGLEINSFLNVDINRCTFANSFTGAAILLNNGGGMPTPEKQKITIRNCTMGPNDGTNGFSNIIARYTAAAPFGTLEFKNLKLYDGVLMVRGAYHQLSIKDVSYVNTVGWSNGGYVDQSAIEIDHYALKGQVIIDGVNATYACTYANPNNTANSYVNLNAVRFLTLSDVLLNVRNVQLNNKLVSTGSAIAGGGPTLAVVKLPGTIAVDNPGFSTQSLFSGGTGGNWSFDSGSAADVLVTGGALTPIGTLTNEVRAFTASASGDYYTGGTVGPQSDVNVELQFTPGTTVTGFKGGVLGKCVSATTYSCAYVYDNGTTSFLCLDKIVNGTRTSMLGSIVGGGAGTVTAISSPPSNVSDRGVQLNARIATSVPFYVRFRQQGTAVRADVHSSAMGYGTTSTNTASATFTTAADIAALVEPYAYSGYVWVPISSNATIDNYNYYRMYVVGGSLHNLSFISTSGTSLAAAYSVINGLTTQTTRFFGGPLRLVNSGVGRHAGLTTVAAIDTLNDVGQFIKQENYRLQNGTVATVAAPSSGASYTNNNGASEQIYWYGGTLTTPYVEFSPDGGTTWSQLRNASADGSIFLLPGDMARWTYSSAPTFKRIVIT
jgi:hypothetical protein